MVIIKTIFIIFLLTIYSSYSYGDNGKNKEIVTPMKYEKDFDRSFLEQFLPKESGTAQLQQSFIFDSVQVATVDLNLVITTIKTNNLILRGVTTKVIKKSIKPNLLLKHKELLDLILPILLSDIEGSQNSILDFKKDGLYDRKTGELSTYYGRKNNDSKTIGNIYFTSALKRINGCTCIEHTEKDTTSISSFLRSYSCNKVGCTNHYSSFKDEYDGITVEIETSIVKYILD